MTNWETPFTREWIQHLREQTEDGDLKSLMIDESDKKTHSQAVRITDFRALLDQVEAGDPNAARPEPSVAEGRSGWVLVSNRLLDGLLATAKAGGPVR
ncbi:MAG TPA: hypothetical protein VFQ11_01965 [Nocardioidaceae bacterium]|nr:hypothetical protein [Nocardioidaceae bacterium]